ncbi:MAG: hypothetical protein JNM30_02875 [Rhodospirillales bacterium]|nr:hypothetical protein [Rhodospirillales bacterium]
MPKSRRLEWALAILLTLVGVAVLTVGFLGGLKMGSYRFARMIEDERRTETLLGGLKHVRTPAEDMPGILAIYGLKPGEERKLADIAWVPPPAPAPFVGTMAKPGRVANATINEFGFRDRRTQYLPKPPGVYRVFITGGSTAFGSGAESDDATLAGELEKLLSKDRRVEVVNTALPAWVTTHERVLIEQRLVALAPDRIVMVSGFNDILWGTFGVDTRWFFTFNDQHFLALLNQVQRRIGQDDLGHPHRFYRNEPVDCAVVAGRAQANVEGAARAARAVGADLVYVLQPSLFSTAKPLTPREVRARDKMAGWTDRFRQCYAAMRLALGSLQAPGYRFVDLSQEFGDLPEAREFFIDASHFPGEGNRILARKIQEALDWPRP